MILTRAATIMTTTEKVMTATAMDAECDLVLHEKVGEILSSLS